MPRVCIHLAKHGTRKVREAESGCRASRSGVLQAHVRADSFNRASRAPSWQPRWRKATSLLLGCDDNDIGRGFLGPILPGTLGDLDLRSADSESPLAAREPCKQRQAVRCHVMTHAEETVSPNRAAYMRKEEACFDMSTRSIKGRWPCD
jgi:hypothetical protein